MKYQTVQFLFILFISKIIQQYPELCGDLPILPAYWLRMVSELHSKGQGDKR